MKIFLLLLFLQIFYARQIKRIIRKKFDHLQLTFRGEDLKKQVEKEFSSFNSQFEYFYQKTKDCIDKLILFGNQAKESCIGNDFESFDYSFDMMIFKMYNVYENMIELAFNENCMNQESDIQSCTRMLNDIKILIFNKYEIVHTINSNRNKYINEDFTQQDFLNILEMVKFVEDKWKITEKEIQNQKDIIRGQIWEYFIAKQEEMRKSSLYDPNDKDIGMMNEIGGEDKFFAKKLMGEIKNGFGSFKNEYGEFLKNKGIVDPNYHQKDLDFEKQFPTQEEQMVDRSTNTNKNISKKSEIQSKQEIKKKVVF